MLVPIILLCKFLFHYNSEKHPQSSGKEAITIFVVGKKTPLKIDYYRKYYRFARRLEDFNSICNRVASTWQNWCRKFNFWEFNKCLNFHRKSSLKEKVTETKSSVMKDTENTMIMTMHNRIFVQMSTNEHTRSQYETFYIAPHSLMASN